MTIERSKEAQQAQTIRIKPRWHMIVLEVVYYLVMALFLVFCMLPLWSTALGSFKFHDEIASGSPVAFPLVWTMTGYANALKDLGVPLLFSLVVTILGAHKKY